MPRRVAQLYPLRLHITAREHVLLSGSLWKPVLNKDAVWIYEDKLHQIQIMLPKSEPTSISRCAAASRPPNATPAG